MSVPVVCSWFIKKRKSIYTVIDVLSKTNCFLPEKFSSIYIYIHVKLSIGLPTITYFLVTANE